jgi:hypothetical protein
MPKMQNKFFSQSISNILILPPRSPRPMLSQGKGIPPQQTTTAAVTTSATAAATMSNINNNNHSSLVINTNSPLVVSNSSQIPVDQVTTLAQLRFR